MQKHETWPSGWFRPLRQGVRAHDRLETVAGLLLSGTGLGLLALAPPLIAANGDRVWSFIWVAAAVAVLAAAVIAAPVVRGAALVVLILTGTVTAGAGLLRIGVEDLSAAEREAVRDTAALLRHRVADLPPGTKTTSAVLVRELCERAGGQLSAPPWTCETPQPPSGDAPAPLTELERARAGASLTVAEAELRATAGTDQAERARDVVSAARADLQTAGLERVDFAEALSAGAGAVADDLLPGDTQIPLALGVVGWTLVAAAAIALVRWTAVRNAAHGLGPVIIEPLDDHDEMWLRCREQFRTCLLDNVPEPGTIPNADAITKVADLVGSIVPKAEPGAKSVQALLKALTIARGYVVQVGVARSVAADVDQTAGRGIVVRVRTAQTSRLLAQREFTLETATQDRVVREAAYWAAAVVIEKSNSVPVWARWSRAAAAPLAEYEHLRAEHPPGLSSSTDARGLLLQAANQSRSSGLVLLKLAHEEERAGHFADALAHALTAANLYPRYVDLTYRLASEASMLASVLGSADSWHVAATLSASRRCVAPAGRYLGQTHPLVGALKAAAALTDVPSPALFANESDATTRLREELLAFSRAERLRSRRRLGVPRLGWNALHATERQLWLSLLFHPTVRSGWQRRLTSARLGSSLQLRALRGRPSLGAVDELKRRWLERLARSGDVLWQVPYNLACYHAMYDRYGPDREDHLRRARDLLERACVARGNEQLQVEWLQKDPDLAGLRRDRTWWLAFISQWQSSTGDAHGPGPQEPSEAVLALTPASGS